jgi:protein phosphatase
MTTSLNNVDESRAFRRAFAESHVGLVRDGNEDACAVSSVSDRVSTWSGLISRHDGWALIADGVGGHVAGEIASALAIEIMRPLMSALQTDEDIQNAVNEADTGLFMAMEMRPELHGMGTTIAGVLLRQGGAITFSAGDSRAYAFKDGVLTQMNVDDRGKGGYLLQCLGGFQEPVPIYVHTRRVEGEPTIVLCTDGLTDLIADDQICAILSGPAANPALALVDAALNAGGHDNVTAVVVQSPS